MSRLRARIFASFGVALLIIVTGWVGASTISVGVTARDRLQRIRDVVEASQRVERDLRAAESATRGFVLTSDPTELAAYQRAVEQRDPLAPLEQLIDATPAIAPLRTNIEHTRNELAAVIAAAQQGEHATAVDRLREESGERNVDRIVAQLAGLLEPNLVLRESLRERMSSSLSAGRAIVLGGSLLAFVLAVIVNLSLMRAVRERETTQKMIVEQSEQLQRQTATLIAHDRQLGERLEAHQQLSSALQRSNEELDRFAYATSHDLKAPLRGIVNLANWIEEDLGAEVKPEVSRNIELLRSRSRRLEALIDGILAYSRAGRVFEKPELVDVRALTNEITELVAPPAGVVVTAAPELPKILTERVPLQQILMNLVGNAIKHGCPEEKGRVEVTAEPAGDRWRIIVCDQGPGIDEQFHERIFGIFQSLAPRDVVEGSGIGLSVVKRIVESRGGTVRVDSKPGAGAKFSFEWPGAAA